MRVLDTKIHDVKIIEPNIYTDDRGFFYESFNLATFKEILGLSVDFVQDNHSRSTKGVLRGMHYQLSPHQQGKLVRCTRGEVYDVAVDIRPSSPTYKQWVGVTLSEHNKMQLWIPPGLAHGFLVLSDVADFLYKTTDYWHPKLERSLRWDDPDLNIEWPKIGQVIISDKDLNAGFFSSLES